MITGTVCLSHTPVMDRARADPAVEGEFRAAVGRANQMIEDWAPELIILFFPDHFNGFFYDLMPQFCIGARGSSVGDFGTVPGALTISEAMAVACARDCLAGGMDVSVSYRMKVDHGAAQPLELLSQHLPEGGLVPIFINCAAPPRTSFARAVELGAAVGQWAAGLDQRVLFIASGGLSHDPPLPSMANASREVQERLIDGHVISHTARTQRQDRVFSQISSYVEGRSQMVPINESWDRALIDHFLEGRLDSADGWDDEEITKLAGCGAHEVRTWFAALSALRAGRGGYTAKLEFYHPIKEWLTGTSLLTAQAA